MRKRGASGGGTLRRKSPQQGQWPSLPRGVVKSARSQWPRASQSGLMHCTVKPGKYCIYSPSVAAKLRSIRLRPFDGCNQKKFGAPLGGQNHSQKNPRENPAQKAQDKQRDGGDCAASGLWCQEKRLQDIVVRLRRGGD